MKIGIWMRQAAWLLVVMLSGALLGTGAAQAQSGGDYVEVYRLTGGDTLNIRSGPSTSEDVLGRAKNGVVLLVHSCKTRSGIRWCEVETTKGKNIVGWANAKYLRVTDESDDDEQSFGGEQTVSCKSDSGDCLSEARKICGGSYSVISSESHAGGLVSDKLPGPVTWYSMTFECGPSDGRKPSFRFRGPSTSITIVVPNVGGGSIGGGSANTSTMIKYCQGEAAGRYDTRPTNIDMRGAEKVPSGYEVFGSYDSQEFYCEFDSKGNFLSLN